MPPLVVILLVVPILCVGGQERSFVIDDGGFQRDGKTIQLISGSFHYFRVPQNEWEDRMIKMRAGGLNTIQTYIPWNFHERKRGKVELDGLEYFLKLAQKHGWMVIARPGPYICAEWTRGGLPQWVMEESHVRTSDPTFMDFVRAWFAHLGPLLAKHTWKQGGSIVMVQVENEYGSFGSDKAYLDVLKKDWLHYLGKDIVLYSTDGASDLFLSGSLVKGIFPTVDFGPGVDCKVAFQEQLRFSGHGPCMNSEYYTGWLTHWGDKHVGPIPYDEERFLQDLRAMLRMNASVNLYMYVGGTNFGYFAGANTGETEEQLFSDITSYDYQAPISETGNCTSKFYSIRNVIGEFVALPPLVPCEVNNEAYGSISMISYVPLLDERTLDLLSNHRQTNLGVPPPMRMIGGLGLYSTFIKSDPPRPPALRPEIEAIQSWSHSNLYWMDDGTQNASEKDAQEECNTLVVDKVRDRIHVWVNNDFQGILERGRSTSLTITHGWSSGATLSFLTEGLGGVNYGPFLAQDEKGLVGGARLCSQFLSNFSYVALPLETLPSHVLDWMSVPLLPPLPAFFRGYLSVNSTAKPTYIEFVGGWKHGFLFVNGEHLGRYWDKGPQFTLLVLPSFLKVGQNEFVVLELDHVGTRLASRWSPLYS